MVHRWQFGWPSIVRWKARRSEARRVSIITGGGLVGPQILTNSLFLLVFSRFASTMICWSLVAWLHTGQVFWYGMAVLNAPRRQAYLTQALPLLRLADIWLPQRLLGLHPFTDGH